MCVCVSIRVCHCVISQIDNKLLLKTAVREMCHVSNFDDCFLLVDIGFWLSFDFPPAWLSLKAWPVGGAVGTISRPKEK